MGALQGLWKNGYGRLGVFLNVYFLLFQMSAHTAIALNRYFAIVRPLSNWNAVSLDLVRRRQECFELGQECRTDARNRIL